MSDARKCGATETLPAAAYRYRIPLFFLSIYDQHLARIQPGELQLGVSLFASHHGALLEPTDAAELDQDRETWLPGLSGAEPITPTFKVSPGVWSDYASNYTAGLRGAAELLRGTDAQQHVLVILTDGILDGETKEEWAAIDSALRDILRVDPHLRLYFVTVCQEFAQTELGIQLAEFWSAGDKVAHFSAPADGPHEPWAWIRALAAKFFPSLGRAGSGHWIGPADADREQSSFRIRGHERLRRVSLVPFADGPYDVREVKHPEALVRLMPDLDDPLLLVTGAIPAVDRPKGTCAPTHYEVVARATSFGYFNYSVDTPELEWQLSSDSVNILNNEPVTVTARIQSQDMNLDGLAGCFRMEQSMPLVLARNDSPQLVASDDWEWLFTWDTPNFDRPFRTHWTWSLVSRDEPSWLAAEIHLPISVSFRPTALPVRAADLIQPPDPDASNGNGLLRLALSFLYAGPPYTQLEVPMFSISTRKTDEQLNSLPDKYCPRDPVISREDPGLTTGVETRDFAVETHRLAFDDRKGQTYGVLPFVVFIDDQRDLPNGQRNFILSFFPYVTNDSDGCGYGTINVDWAGQQSFTCDLSDVSDPTKVACISTPAYP